jgi:23S rRNA-/tRNA-specific pseudouridylate synthase
VNVIGELQKILGDGVTVAKYDGNGLIALDKPCGILSHPNGNGDRGRAILRCGYDPDERAYVPPCGGKFYLLNRLDSPVSGLILVAISRETAEAAKEPFGGKKVRKEYVALTKGFERHSRAFKIGQKFCRRGNGSVRRLRDSRGNKVRMLQILPYRRNNTQCDEVISRYRYRKDAPAARALCPKWASSCRRWHLWKCGDSFFGKNLRD